MKDLCLEFLSHRQLDLVAGGPLPQGLAFLVTASQQLILLACLVVPAMLLIESRRHGAAYRRVFGLIALLIVFAGLAPCLAVRTTDATSWSGALVLFGAAAAIWGVSLALLRFLPSLPGIVQMEERTDELERLRRLEAAVAWTGDGVLIAASAYPGDPNAKVLYANAAFIKMTGLESQGMAGEGMIHLPEPGVHTAVEAALRHCLPTRIEAPGCRSDGTAGWAEWHIVPLMNREAGRREWIAILRDMTGRRTRPDREHPVSISRECNETIESPGVERTQSGIVRHLQSRERTRAI